MRPGYIYQYKLTFQPSGCPRRVNRSAEIGLLTAEIIFSYKLCLMEGGYYCSLKKMPNYNFNLTIFILEMVLHICFLIFFLNWKTKLECLLLNLTYNVVGVNLEIGNK